MAYSKEQIEELKGYCKRVGALTEIGIDFPYLEALRLPAGCMPEVCDALLCPVAKDGYPSTEKRQLTLSTVGKSATCLEFQLLRSSPIG
jgi:hypothetical protein